MWPMTRDLGGTPLTLVPGTDIEDAILPPMAHTRRNCFLLAPKPNQPG